MRPHKPWPGDFGSVSAHSHQNLTSEWELCTENDCEVYEAEAAQSARPVGTKGRKAVGTINDKEMVDAIIEANGQRDPEDRPVVKIVRYSNMFNGRTAYGLIYEGEDLDKYRPSDAIIDPETIWEREAR